MNQSATHALDRSTRIADLGRVMHNLLRPGVTAFAVFAAGATSLLFYADNPAWFAFLLMAGGVLVALLVWRNRGIGLPLLPTIAVQHLLAYGTPIVNEHETLAAYPPEYLTDAGWEVCILLLTLSLAWRWGMEMFRPGTSVAYALRVFETTPGDAGRARLGFILVLATTSYEILDSMQLVGVLFEVLPAGSYSLVTALMNATTMAGYFLLAMQVGSGDCAPSLRLFFWATLAVNLVLLSSTFLLSSPIGMVAAATIGLFWSSGRIPWKLLVCVSAFLSFLHLGKFEMRERYWESADGEAVAAATLQDLPDRYVEWFDASYRHLTGQVDESRIFGPQEKETASMLDRVNNLQNLLYAINAVEGQRVPTLDGATYALIPPLLIPRILWPEKPRTHEGQILLNVHFGRQSLTATYKTYVAWGLLPEAYGNFGRWWGAVILGVSLGLIFAWIESATVNKQVLSLEGLVTFAVFSGIAISFEMVSTVLVTSLFQTSIVITLACLPFVERTITMPSPPPSP
jgi:hypothetical protein